MRRPVNVHVELT